MSKNKNKWLENYIMFFSLQEREKREYIRYKNEYEKLEKISVSELSSRYVNTKSMHEHKKNVFSFFVVTILMATIMGVWEHIYSFCVKILEMIYLNQGKIENISIISFIVASGIFTFMIVLAFIFLISSIKELYILHKKLLIIEEVRNT